MHDYSLIRICLGLKFVTSLLNTKDPRDLTRKFIDTSAFVFVSACRVFLLLGAYLLKILFIEIFIYTVILSTMYAFLLLIFLTLLITSKIALILIM
jgi:hypothetical protein